MWLELHIGKHPGKNLQSKSIPPSCTHYSSCMNPDLRDFLNHPRFAYKKMGNVVITSLGMTGKINGWFIIP